MSDDDPDSLDTTFPTFSLFNSPGNTDPSVTRHRHRTSPSADTPIGSLTPFLPFSTPFDATSLPSPTQTGDLTMTDAFPSSTGTPDTSTPTDGDSGSFPLISTDSFLFLSPPLSLPADSSLDSLFSITVTSLPSWLESSDSSNPTDTPYPPTSSFSDDPLSSTLSSISLDSSFTTDSFLTSASTLTTSDLSLTTSSTFSPSPTPSTSSRRPTPTPTPTQSTSLVPSSSLPPSLSPSSVTTTSFPSFSGGSGTQSKVSTTSPGAIVAATTGAIALAIILALLAIMCRKRHLNQVRGRANPDTFLDLDNEMAAVNQPLIVGDAPAPGGAEYVDPFTDDSRPRTQSQSRSLSVDTTGPGTSLARSNNSFQAVAGAMPVPDPRGGLATGYYNQQPTNRRSPPLVSPPPGIAQPRPYQPFSQAQIQLPPDPPIPRQSSPSFDAGAIAYIRNNDPASGPSLPSPTHSPRSGEDHRLITAFSVASELSPQYPSPIPPPNIDEMWRDGPGPVQASAAYRPSFDRRRSFTPDVSGHVYDPYDSVVISPTDMRTPGFTQGPISPGPNVSNPYTFRGGNYGSHPSPITEVTEMQHSQEGSGGSGGTWNSNKSTGSGLDSPVVMTAERVHLTPTAPSLVTPRSGSTGSHYEDSMHSLGSPNIPPPLPSPPPPLPPIQPLSFAKKRSLQGTS